MAGYFSEKTLDTLHRGRSRLKMQYIDLWGRYYSRSYRSERAREYAVHGFCRRLAMLLRAVDRVFEILPPELEDIPEREDVEDATIAIQSFVLNTFGCFDNLLWVWVFEKDVKEKDGSDLKPKDVSLGNKLVRGSFTDEFRAYIDSRQDWFNHIRHFRDSLAHRIPLYIPPYVVATENIDEHNRLERAAVEALNRPDIQEHDRLRSEQKKLARFRPWMTHSVYEQSPMVVFHGQLLADYNTVDEFGRTMLEELNR
jgi:hypothetical protein